MLLVYPRRDRGARKTPSMQTCRFAHHPAPRCIPRRSVLKPLTPGVPRAAALRASRSQDGLIRGPAARIVELADESVLPQSSRREHTGKPWRKRRVGQSPLFCARKSLSPATESMALALDTIRATADRVAASHQLEVVELEFSGGAKHRTLAHFYRERTPRARARAGIELARAGRGRRPARPDRAHPRPARRRFAPEQLSGVTTHEDCEAFTRDFGTLLDIEDLVPGAEYTLEVSSPGLERRARRTAADYTRFTGSARQAPDFYTGIRSRGQTPAPRSSSAAVSRPRLKTTPCHPRSIRYQAQGQAAKRCHRPNPFRHPISPTSKKPTLDPGNLSKLVSSLISSH